MSTIIATEIVVLAQDKSYRIPGNRSAEFVKTSYASDIPGLSNMDVTEEVQTRTEGEVKVLTFRNRVGTKG